MIASGEYNTLYKFLTGASAPTAGSTPQGFGRFGGGGISQQQTPSSDFYDLNGKLTYNLTPRYILSLSYYGSGDDYDSVRAGIVHSKRLGFSFAVRLPSSSNNTTQGK